MNTEQLTADYKRGDRLRAEDVNALIQHAKDPSYLLALANANIQNDKEEANYIPFEIDATYGVCGPHAVMAIRGTKRMSGDEGYLVGQLASHTTLGNLQPPFYLINGPAHAKGSVGSTGYGSFCFEGGWIAYDHTDGHPEHFDEWYYGGNKKLVKTYGVAAAITGTPFIALGGYKKIPGPDTDYYVGRFVQRQPFIQARYSGFIGGPGQAIADDEAFALPVASGNQWNISLETNGTDTFLKFAASGNYKVTATISMEADNDTYVSPTMQFLEVHLHRVTTAGVVGPAGNIAFKGIHAIINGSVKLPAYSVFDAIVPFNKDEGFLFKNQSGLDIQINYCTLTIHRIGPYEIAGFDPYP